MTKQVDRLPVIVAAIATGATQKQAAQVAGCSERTVRNVLAGPGARQALDAERRRLAEQVADALIGTVVATVERLRRIADQGNDRDAVGAARVLLAEARAWRDTAWTVDRIEALEDELAIRRRAG